MQPSPQACASSSMLPSEYPAERQLQLDSHINCKWRHTFDSTAALSIGVAEGGRRNRSEEAMEWNTAVRYRPCREDAGAIIRIPQAEISRARARAVLACLLIKTCKTYHKTYLHSHIGVNCIWVHGCWQEVHRWDGGRGDALIAETRDG